MIHVGFDFSVADAASVVCCLLVGAFTLGRWIGKAENPTSDTQEATDDDYLPDW